MVFGWFLPIPRWLYLGVHRRRRMQWPPAEQLMPCRCRPRIDSQKFAFMYGAVPEEDFHILAGEIIFNNLVGLVREPGFDPLVGGRAT